MNNKKYIEPSIKVIKMEKDVIATSMNDVSSMPVHNIVDDAEEL